MNNDIIESLECKETELGALQVLQEILMIGELELSNEQRKRMLRMLDRFVKYHPNYEMADKVYDKFIIINPNMSFIYDEYPETDRKFIKTLEQALVINNWTVWRYDEFLNLPWWRTKTKEEQKILTDFTAVVLDDVEPSEVIKTRANIYFNHLSSERGVRCTKALDAKFHQES